MRPSIFKLSETAGKRAVSIPVLEKYGATAKISTRDFDSASGFLLHMNIDPGSAVMAEQVHGANIRVVDKEDLGSGTLRSPIKSCDALITNKTHIPLVIRTADCIPLFILDPVKRAIALVHIGWKGGTLKIAEKTLKRMIEAFDISPSNCIIVAGPHIRRDCYEVDSKVIGPLKESFKDHEKYIIPKDNGHWYLDLLALNIGQMKELGVKESNIHHGSYCTHCKTDMFYSYRKEGGKAGRIFSVIMLK
ncbi:peptidoglycan editing factor PgeF [Candidatus Margulisiibacteriota bacterium]